MSFSKLRYSSVYLFIGALACLEACSSESTSLVGRTYNNVTAHYNGYFYSREEIAKIEQTIWKGHVDDYNRVLKLFPSPDSVQAKGYDKEAQEAIKMASLAIQRHPHSHWVDDCYILVGKARLYTLDWGNAIQTFKYVNTKSKDPNARHHAIITLIRTFVEHGEFNNAQAAIDFLLKEKLNRINKKRFYLEKAFYHQVLNDYDNMVRSLTSADPYLKRKDKRGRIYFVIGQVYQKLGFDAEAYNYYKKCLSTNPEYEVDFYARLYQAQVAQISRSRNVAAARRSFKILLKDAKNRDFKDKIYYEMGVFELKQRSLEAAITNFNLSLRSGKNKRVHGEAYLRLGEINYDTLHNYERSQAYYDSALAALPKDYEGYTAIKNRADILDEFVKHIKTIQWQDSLLEMASLDSMSLRKRIDSVLTAQKKPEKKKRRGANRIDIGNNQNTNMFAEAGDGDEDGNTTESVTTNTGTDGATWYFDNTSTVAQGQGEFTRVWGNIVLEDNWRRSARAATVSTAAAAENTDTKKDEKPKEKEGPPADPVALEYAKLVKDLPRTEPQKKDAYKKIEDAYFALGDIYYFKLHENKNAASTYNKLLDRFPESEHTPEVLYKLYLILKDIDPMQASQVANRLKENYPNTTFARILINPNFVKETSEAAEKQKEKYKIAYQFFVDSDYRNCLEVITEAMALGETSFTPNLKLLKVLIVGKTEDIAAYQYALQQFIETNPDAEVTGYAKTLLETSRSFQQKQEKSKGIQYVESFEESHYFVIISQRDDRLSEKISGLLEEFNKTNFKDLQLKTSSLLLGDNFIVSMVSELPRLSYALEYCIAFNEKLPTFTVLENRKIYNFAITKDNFDILYRTKGLDEYIKFFNKHYHPENQGAPLH